MPEFTIKEVVGGTLDDSAVGFDWYVHKNVYLVLRDGARVKEVRECKSLAEAQAAIRRLKEADSKKAGPR
jgi:hypothetical protein